MCVTELVKSPPMLRVILNWGHDFLGSAKGQHELLCSMLKRLEGLHKDMSKYFSFDAKKYAIEEFFGDIKAFKDGLQVLNGQSTLFLGGGGGAGLYVWDAID